MPKYRRLRDATVTYHDLVEYTEISTKPHPTIMDETVEYVSKRLQGQVTAITSTDEGDLLTVTPINNAPCWSAYRHEVCKLEPIDE